jgi:hypothetical protein
LDLIRTLFTVALVVLLTAALALGNCVRCTDLIPVQKQTHDCCETEQSPAPAPKDCAGKTTDFEKVVQPDQGKSTGVPADAPVPVPTPAVQLHVEVTEVAVTAVHLSFLNSPLRI